MFTSWQVIDNELLLYLTVVEEPIPMEQEASKETPSGETKDRSVEKEMEGDVNVKKEKPSHDHSKDPVTVFVKNLAYNLTEERIRKLFHEVSKPISLKT